MDVNRLEMNQLADPQSGRVGGHEQDAVQKRAGGLEQAYQFLLAVDFRQFAGACGASNAKSRLAQHLTIEEGDGRGVPVAGT